MSAVRARVHASAVEGGESRGGRSLATRSMMACSDCTAASAQRAGAQPLPCPSVCASMICTWHATSVWWRRVRAAGGRAAGGRAAAGGGGRRLLHVPHPSTSVPAWQPTGPLAAATECSWAVEERPPASSAASGAGADGAGASRAAGDADRDGAW